jgi:hypothetical protein
LARHRRQSLQHGDIGERLHHPLSRCRTKRLLQYCSPGPRRQLIGTLRGNRHHAASRLLLTVLFATTTLCCQRLLSSVW